MNRLFTALVAAAALWIAACSGGGSTITPPPPTGKYGPSSLNGTYAFVLTSTGGGFMMDETASGNQASTGSGNFVLQNSAAFASGVSGSYVFDFTGLDGTQPPGGPNPESLVGRFTASGGVITSGLEDANDNGSLTSSARDRKSVV